MQPADIRPARQRLGGAQRAEGEHAGGQRAENACHAMHAEHVQAVVIAQPRLQHRHRPEAQRAGDNADRQRRPRQHEPRRRGDRHQPGHRAGRSRPAPRACRAGTIPRNSRTAWRRRRRSASPAPPCRCAPDAPSAPPELKPSQPTHSSDAPITAKAQVPRRHVLLPEAEPAAQHQGADQAGDAGVDLHHRAAGEVGDAHGVQPAVRRPTPSAPAARTPAATTAS